MIGPQFFQTRMGMRFFEVDVPNAVKAVVRVAEAIEKLRQSPVVASVAPVVPRPFIEDEAYRLRAALRLIECIADYPDRNPGETVVLAPKTREQINNALRETENDGS
jgi:hypothetical protein